MNYLIDEKEKIQYDNYTYYLRIRSQNVENPVVLFLHGGCGSPDRAQVLKYQSTLSEKFTLVCWDQRGSGLAYDKNEAKTLELTKEIYVNDAHNVVLYLKKRFNKDKIIIVGHSFGSVLGVWLAQEYPEDILYYVGIGQVVDYVLNEQESYKATLDLAKQFNDKKSISKLEKIGAPVNGLYSDNQKEHNKRLMVQRSFLHKYGGATFANRKPYWQELLFHELPIIKKEYSLREIGKYIKGIMYCINSPLGATNPKFLDTCKELSVPVYLLLGKHDLNCPSLIADKWFNELTAPDKKLIWFNESAHSPQWEESKIWNEEFIKLYQNF